MAPPRPRPVGVPSSVVAFIAGCLLGPAAALRFMQPLVKFEDPPPSYFYSYGSHGQDWVQGRCGSRERQSPLDFQDLETPSTGVGFYYNYQSIQKPFYVRNPDGMQLIADFFNNGDGGVTYQNGWYNLVAIEVHSLSEHTFLGNHSPVELHIVHHRDDSEFDGPPYVTLALPIVSPNHPFAEVKELIPEPSYKGWNSTTQWTPPPAGDPEFNQLLQRMFLDSEPPVGGNWTAVIADDTEPLDLNPFPKDGEYFAYLGSQTRPPCQENVAWFLRRNVLMASDAQLEMLHYKIYQHSATMGNWRSTMQVNGRPLDVKTCEQGEPPLKADDYSGVISGTQPLTEHELRAMNWMRDAIKQANGARANMKDLDERLHKAADAHVEHISAFPRPGQKPPAAVSVAGTTPPPGTGMAKAVRQAAAHQVEVSSKKMREEAAEQTIPNAEDAFDITLERKAMIDKAKLAAMEAAGAPSPSPQAAAGDEDAE